MQSSKIRIRVLCAVVLASCAGAACGDLNPQAQNTNGSGGTSAGSDGNPGSSGTSPVSNGGSDPTSSAGSLGSVGGDTAGSSGSGGASSAGTGGAGGSLGGGTGGALGAAGTGGTGGSAVVDACAHTGARTKTDLTPTNGRVECTTNDFGIEGDWKLNSSDPDLMSVSFTGSTVCGKGKIAQVVPTTGTTPDFGRYWGGGLAFVMHNEGAGLPAEAYNATTNGFSGISAKITANTGTIPAQMRFKFKMIGVNDSFCEEVDGATSGQTIVLHTGDAIHNCWMPDTTATLDVTMIENYEVQVVSQTSGDVPFDFCLTEITALGT